MTVLVLIVQLMMVINFVSRLAATEIAFLIAAFDVTVHTSLPPGSSINRFDARTKALVKPYPYNRTVIGLAPNRTVIGHFLKIEHLNS